MEVVTTISKKLTTHNFKFSKAPIVIGGMAMEYYGIRKSGADIDLVICDEDYQKLSNEFPNERKDIYGDLGIVIWPFEIWRSIALLDYDFFSKDAINHNDLLIVSLDKLLFMRVSAMDVQKYLDDLKLMKEYYYSNFRNKNYLKEAEMHIPSYEKNNGIIWKGEYIEYN